MREEPLEALIERVRTFLTGLTAYRVDRFILFGSRVRGDHLRHSDLDVLLISEDFARVPFPERPDLFYGAWQEDPDLDFICYTPEELEKKRGYKGLVSTALEEGIDVRLAPPRGP